MGFQFCWEFNACRNSCPIKDLKILFCWNYYREERSAGLRPCPACPYYSTWSINNFKAGDSESIPVFQDTPDRKKTILAIDDEQNILFALEETINIQGYTCVSAADGEDGLAIAREIKPDLIISDIIMPKLNGYDLCKTLKTDWRTRHIPIILVSVKTSKLDRMEGQLCGADAYITKPFRLSHLKEKITLLMNKGSDKSALWP